MRMFILTSDLHKFIWQREQYKEAKEYILGLEKQIEKSQDFLMNAGMVLWDAEIELGGNEEGFKVALSKLENGIRKVIIM